MNKSGENLLVQSLSDDVFGCAPFSLPPKLKDRSQSLKSQNSQGN